MRSAGHGSSSALQEPRWPPGERPTDQRFWGQGVLTPSPVRSPSFSNSLSMDLHGPWGGRKGERDEGREKEKESIWIREEAIPVSMTKGLPSFLIGVTVRLYSRPGPLRGLMCGAQACLCIRGVIICRGFGERDANELFEFDSWDKVRILELYVSFDLYSAF